MSDHPRSGGLELQNERVGFDLKGAVSMSASAYGSKDGSKSKEPEEPGVTDAAKLGYDLSKDKPIAERYAGGYWSSTDALAGDAGFQRLRKAIDDQAAMSEGTREARNKQQRERVGKVAAFSALFVPAGTVAAAAFLAFSEGLIALDGLMNDPKKDKRDRERVDRDARKLWAEWMISPPSHDPMVEAPGRYADRIETILRVLQMAENAGEPFRAEWLQTMAAGIDSPIPAARDVSALGWIPVDMTSWFGVGYFKQANGKLLWKEPYKDKGFGTVTTITRTPSKLSAERATTNVYTVPTFEEMVARCDPFAAGIGVMVAVRYNVAIEPVVEAAVTASRQWLEAAGPNVDMAGYRLKGVFEQAVRAAKMSPPNPMLVKRGLTDGRIASLKTVKQAQKEATDKLILKGTAFMLVQKAIGKKKIFTLEDRGFRDFKQWRVRAPKLPTPKVPSK